MSASPQQQRGIKRPAEAMSDTTDAPSQPHEVQDDHKDVEAVHEDHDEPDDGANKDDDGLADHNEPQGGDGADGNAGERGTKQQRREKKRVIWLAQKERIKAEKAAKAAARAAKAAADAAAGVVPYRRPSNVIRAQQFREACAAGQRIIIDLDFVSLMREREIISMVQQVMYCYSILRRAKVKVRLELTSVTGPIDSGLKQISGYTEWPVWPHAESFIELFKKEDLVYLTADSPNIIHELDTTKAYIIGGIVDRNRYPGLTYKKALDLGIATAKLPIGEFIHLRTSPVMAVNHVFDILCRVNDGASWKDAFMGALPTRKQADDDDESGTDNDDTTTTAEATAIAGAGAGAGAGESETTATTAATISTE